MNKRIEKIAADCGLAIRHDGIVLTKNVNAAEAFERFAETLVHECIQTVSDYEEEYPNINDTWVYTGVRDQLRENFGIKR